jgi:hypothetical protein
MDKHLRKQSASLEELAKLPEGTGVSTIRSRQSRQNGRPRTKGVP